MVFQRIAAILAEIIEEDSEDITPETPLTKASGFEALQMAKLVMACEGRFKVTIHDEDILSFKCVQDLVEYIERILSDK